MHPEDWNRVKHIFAKALAASASERQAILRQCDAELRSRIESLLQIADEGRDGMRTLAADGLDRTPTWSGMPTLPTAPMPQPHDRIGPYKLIQIIGEGGFGTVYVAEQEQPVRRRVAIKIIKLGMDTRQVVARFEQERQALALMEHPHIARVFDAGATPSGRPYFAMEYVKGEPINRFADARRLGIPERLELFIQVCKAVQHAHEKGIIHRDLKPGNVLVHLTDGRPFAKIIDFGIAKATGAQLTDKTVFTEQFQIIGTPEYMSPEQAEGSSQIDTRTDVYALGVILYELLAGATPFDAARLRSVNFQNMLRIIREEDPPAPSLRISRSKTLSTIAAARRSEPDKLSALVRGELDWIVMKAISKDRLLRYESPNQLAEDVVRQQACKPVLAAPPSTLYLMRKLAARHKRAVAVVSVVVFALAASTVIATYYARREAAYAQREAKQRVVLQGALEEIAGTYDPSTLGLYDMGLELIENDESAESRLRQLVAIANRALQQSSQLTEDIARERSNVSEAISSIGYAAGGLGYVDMETSVPSLGYAGNDSASSLEAVKDFTAELVGKVAELNEELTTLRGALETAIDEVGTAISSSEVELESGLAGLGYAGDEASSITALATVTSELAAKCGELNELISSYNRAMQEALGTVTAELDSSEGISIDVDLAGLGYINHDSAAGVRPLAGLAVKLIRKNRELQKEIDELRELVDRDR